MRQCLLSFVFSLILKSRWFSCQEVHQPVDNSALTVSSFQELCEPAASGAVRGECGAGDVTRDLSLISRFTASPRLGWVHVFISHWVTGLNKTNTTCQAQTKELDKLSKLVKVICSSKLCSAVWTVWIVHTYFICICLLVLSNNSMKSTISEKTLSRWYLLNKCHGFKNLMN